MSLSWKKIDAGGIALQPQTTQELRLAQHVDQGRVEGWVQQLEIVVRKLRHLGIISRRRMHYLKFFCSYARKHWAQGSSKKSIISNSLQD